MKMFGFKGSLLAAALIVLSGTVLVNSFVSYYNQKALLEEQITHRTQEYAADQADLIGGFLKEKVAGIHRLTERYKEGIGTDKSEDIIELTKSFADAMNVYGTVIAFKNGDAYWTYSTAWYPEHKYKGDINTVGWYKQSQERSGTTITKPYIGSDGKTLWVSIVEKTNFGAIAGYPSMALMSDIVADTSLEGSQAMVFIDDSTVLASSSEEFAPNSKLSEKPWYDSVKNKVFNQDTYISQFEQDGQTKLIFSKQIKFGDTIWYYLIIIDESVVFAPLQDIVWQSSITGGVSIALGCFIIFFVIQLLYKPILSLKSTIVGLSEGNGDLTRRIDVKSKDDLGQIAAAVNLFMENLQGIMLKIQSATHQLEDNIASLNDQSTKNAVTLQNHRSETEQVVTAVTQMSATAESVASDAANTAEITQKAVSAGEESQSKACETQDTVSSLVDEVNSASGHVQEMSAQSNNITSILSVIEDIAEQTNLLALNAAIEAARAGEAGRGFAVVADEVRSLATRSKSCTEEIEKALGQLTNGSNAVVDAMDKTKGRCEETAREAGVTIESLGVMSGHVNEIDQLATQIATAAQEQSAVTHEVSQNMNAINLIVTELDQSGQSTVDEVSKIEHINADLVKIVDQFKLS
ncbi:methyl-accepting chemotaxis protein [Vibrio sp. JC009]|uniref:methyl-accepting chemotaxis protein n=1 Tax=Vibrio sp. JC009 TaxID=2912314 RepID=UPI0023AF4253|nr:methyl-accepting chemotaxis protein [Vibrio sp. JC009]WED23747.1 methyl-accepting chemotaxis protein [Vibrio sp. JC009]